MDSPLNCFVSCSRLHTKRFQTFQEEEEEEVGNRTPNGATAFHVSWYHPCGSFSPKFRIALAGKIRFSFLAAFSKACGGLQVPYCRDSQGPENRLVSFDQPRESYGNLRRKEKKENARLRGSSQSIRCVFVDCPGQQKRRVCIKNASELAANDILIASNDICSVFVSVEIHGY
ncbi:predicted protein [Histoplasma capsulatum H143]|uniref:Uncharacterized protein n=1 Tax=Ajellomyces capsulatus (strain H143) TaxID=544712 RepID=C6HJN8_AJECH|nr:predicted protein [Histoplasma capsulatum H143]